MNWEVQQAYDYRHVELPEGEWFSLSQKINGVTPPSMDQNPCWARFFLSLW